MTSVPVALAVPVRPSRAARTGRFIASLSAPVLVVTALGHRLGAIPTEAAPPLIAIGFALAVAGVSAAIGGAVLVWQGLRQGAGNVAAAILYALPALGLLIASLLALVVYPPLRDISTDPAEPPQFWTAEHAVPPEEARANALVQTQAYPDLTARYYPAGLRLVYDRLKEVLAARGTALTFDTSPEETVGGALLEGTERSLLFAFADDVTFRIATTPDGTRVDVRSVSRIGAHDLGTNARRIRAILKALDDSLLGIRQATTEAPVAPPPASASPAPSSPTPADSR